MHIMHTGIFSGTLCISVSSRRPWFFLLQQKKCFACTRRARVPPHLRTPATEGEKSARPATVPGAHLNPAVTCALVACDSLFHTPQLR